MDHDRQTLSTAEYLHIWEGQFNDEVDGSIIPVDWFNAAIDAHIKLGFKPKGAKIASFDPSDEGGDAKGYALRYGSVILDVAESMQGDVNQGCDWALNRAIAANVDTFTWDCDGLGVSLKRQVNEALSGKKIDSIMFKGSEKPENPKKLFQDGIANDHTFKNKRAQYYWRLRDRFYNTYRAVTKGEYIDPDELISLSSDIDDIDTLRSEVCRIPKKPNNNGLIQIKSKTDMLAMGIPSPNMSDSLMMAMLIPAAADNDFEMSYKSLW
jgi:phage terminase large subunit